MWLFRTADCLEGGGVIAVAGIDDAPLLTCDATLATSDETLSPFLLSAEFEAEYEAVTCSAEVVLQLLFEVLLAGLWKEIAVAELDITAPASCRLKLAPKV